MASDNVQFRHSSVDLRRQKSKVISTKEDLLPVGIRTPLALGSGDEGVFALTYTSGEQLRDNLRNLITTNYGERLMQYDYGANLRAISLQQSVDDTASAAQKNISEAIRRYMPFVILKNLTAQKDKENNNIITLTVNYDIPAANLFNENLNIVLQ